MSDLPSKATILDVVHFHTDGRPPEQSTTTDPLLIDAINRGREAAARIASAQHYVEGGEPGEWEILAVLLAYYPETVLQRDLAHFTNISERSLARKLKKLRARGLTWQPAGPKQKGGETLTPHGLVVAKEILP
jgi:hypothetical protein